MDVNLEMLFVLISRFFRLPFVVNIVRFIRRILQPIVGPVARPLRVLWNRPGMVAIRQQFREAIGLPIAIRWNQAMRHVGTLRGRFTATALSAVAGVVGVGLLLPAFIPAATVSVAAAAISVLGVSINNALSPYFSDRRGYQRAQRERGADVGAVLPNDPGNSLRLWNRPFHELKAKDAEELRSWLLGSPPIDPNDRELTLAIIKLDRTIAETTLWAPDANGNRQYHVVRTKHRVSGVERLNKSVTAVTERLDNGVNNSIKQRLNELTMPRRTTTKESRTQPAKALPSFDFGQASERQASERPATAPAPVAAMTTTAPALQSTMSQDSGMGMSVSI